MKLAIKEIEGASDPTRERIVIEVREYTDLTYYALFQCRLGGQSNNPLTGQVPSAYWFRNKAVAQGDLVIVYSKTGRPSEKITANGKTSHFFYWGTEGLLWTAQRRAVLVYTSAWEWMKDDDDSTVEPLPKSALPLLKS